MNRFAVRGWCPDAWRPMMSGDGLLVRVKPRLGRLTRQQVLGLCDAAMTYGNGLIDVTRRANLQIRGVSAEAWPALLERLIGEGLVDADAATEQRRNLLIAPDWQVGDDSHRIARELLERLDELPELPGKTGFVIDAGETRMLAGEPGDFRIERGAEDGLILRADGRSCGVAVRGGQEVDGLIALARWFAASGGARAGRMARHGAELPGNLTGDELPARCAAPTVPGSHVLGAAYGVPFGRVDGGNLAAASAPALRITPWRILVLEGVPLAPAEGLIADPADPLLRVDACPGAPSCPQATVETREIARLLAPRIAGQLHVSGCEKACACSSPADVTVTGRGGRYDVAFTAKPGSPCAHSALSRAELLAHFESRPMPHIYETDGAAIYRQSFATIRAEADLARFSADEEPVAVRMIHAAGMVGLAAHIRFSPGFSEKARSALAGGAPILCDARMVSEGITRARLPAANPIICTLNAPEVPNMARAMGNTRSAAALELWRPHLVGAVVAIGNAPTALFHLLNMLEDSTCPRPAAIIGCPVGFVGAAESKAALWAAPPVPCCVVEGRLGGSAITVAAINALASRAE